MGKLKKPLMIGGVLAFFLILRWGIWNYGEWKETLLTLWDQRIRSCILTVYKGTLLSGYALDPEPDFDPRIQWLTYKGKEEGQAGELPGTKDSSTEEEPKAKDSSSGKEQKETDSPGVQSTQNNDSQAEAVAMEPVKTNVSLARDQLTDFGYVLGTLFITDADTYLSQGDFDMMELASRDLHMVQTPESPQILIYHTHSQEGFVDTVPGDDTTTIVGVGDVLKGCLESLGYNVIHDRSVYDMADGVLDRNRAYDQARIGISTLLQQYPDIEVVIDLHRDGVAEGIHLVTQINGQNTAKVMFFNGLSRISGIGDVNALYNPYLDTNLAFSLQMKLAALDTYPDFTRTNYLNAYKYNLDLRPKSMLIEAGAQTNTLEEVKNAMEPLALLFHQVLQ